MLLCAADEDACDEARELLGLPSDASITITTTGAVDPGGSVQGTVDDDGQGASLEVAGCGLPSGTDVTVLSDGTFEVALGPGAVTDCVLTFTITFPNGTVQTEAFMVDVIEPQTGGVSGTIIAVDDAANTYRFVTASGDQVDVAYDADDVFQIGGSSATLTAWEAESDVGNQVTFIDDPTPADRDVHNLTHTGPVTSGMIANVDISSNSFDFIEPHTGTVIGTVPSYAGGTTTYRIGNSTVTETAFEADLNEGDRVTIVNPGQTNERFDLTNQLVDGTVTAVVNPAADPVLLQIDIFGDDPATAQDLHFAADSGGDTFSGHANSFVAFQGAITVGDTLRYGRQGGIESYQLTNTPPPPVSGILTSTFDIALDTLELLPENSATPIAVDYSSPTATFRLNSAIAVEADVEAAMTPGDRITFTPDNPDTPGDETRLALTDANLTGRPTNWNDPGNTLDVVNLAGGVISAAQSYVAPLGLYSDASIRYFLGSDPTEVTLAAFELALASLDGDSTITFAPIMSGNTVLGTEVLLS